MHQTVTAILFSLLVPMNVCLAQTAIDRQGSGFPAIVTADHPQAFFFRCSEFLASNREVSYKVWNSTFSRLQGIMGKALGEELPRDEVRNPEFFTRFKKEHPGQMVLLHFNGNARLPGYSPKQFFPGHWVYEEAATILSDIPATAGETDIHVSDTKHFQTNIGRFKSNNVDIGLFRIKDGKHDWLESEQVQLVSVDPANKIIRVKRGCYGTVPKEFKANAAHAAPHEFEGPWSKGAPLLWVYNFSTECPRDARGFNCGDALVADLEEKFRPGGELAAFDGLEFDVARNFVHGDTDGDGKTDDGISNGLNAYGIGVVRFYSKLRDALGDQRLILADGGESLQRAFGILNGVESEGLPHAADLTMKGWSVGINRMTFWNRESRKPVFNYINERFADPAAADLKSQNAPKVPFPLHRLVVAAGQFFDAAVCYSSMPDPEPGERVGIWDELKMGTSDKLNWLGKALDQPVHLASHTPDLLNGAALPSPAVVNGRQTFTWKIACQPPDLFVTVRASCAPLTGYPTTYARLMGARIDNESGDVAKARPVDNKEANKKGLTGWVNGTDFESTFYFRDVKSNEVELTIDVEGTEPVSIHSITAHSAPDVMYRVFEHGLVLANPSLHPYTFDLSKLTPKVSYRHLMASSKQDVEVNTGAPVGGSVTLGPVDGLFLVRTDASSACRSK
jgi:hypothetical protein